MYVCVCVKRAKKGRMIMEMGMNKKKMSENRELSFERRPEKWKFLTKLIACGIEKSKKKLNLKHDNVLTFLIKT